MDDGVYGQIRGKKQRYMRGKTRVTAGNKTKDRGNAKYRVGANMDEEDMAGSRVLEKELYSKPNPKVMMQHKKYSEVRSNHGFRYWIGNTALLLLLSSILGT